MPIYYYKCPKHGIFAKLIKDNTIPIKCKKCNLICELVVNIGNVQSKEVIDNGVMSKRIERYSNIEELIDEHINKHNK